MSYFNNIVSDGINLSFELKNVRLGFANALRRIILAEIPTFAIDDESIYFHNNTSMLHNIFLTNRLILCPIKYSVVADLDLDNFTITLNSLNQDDHMIDILVKDFVINDAGRNIDPKDFFIDDQILFAKLKPNQGINFIAKVKKSMARQSGSAFFVANTAIITYKLDEALIKSYTKDMSPDEANRFMQNEADKYYLKNELMDEPQVFIFNIESVGGMDVNNIFNTSLEVLKEKINNLSSAIVSKNTDKITITPSKKLFEAYDFTIIDEDDTLGNLINTYIHINPLTSYSGYLIPHPKDNKLIITTALKNNNTQEQNIKHFTNTLKEILTLVNKVQNEWNLAATTKTTAVTKKIKIKSKT